MILQANRIRLAAAVFVLLCCGFPSLAAQTDSGITTATVFQIHGTLLDNENKPAIGMTLFLVGVDRMNMVDLSEAASRPRYHATTDASGRFDFSFRAVTGTGGSYHSAPNDIPWFGDYYIVVPPASDGIHAGAISQRINNQWIDYKPQYFKEIIPSYVKLGLEPTSLTLRLAKGVTLTGRVIDETTHPVVGAQIKTLINLHAETHTGMGGEILERSTTTDANGRFRFDNLYPGVQTLSFNLKRSVNPTWTRTRIGERGQWVDDCLDELNLADPKSQYIEIFLPTKEIYEYRGTVRNDKGQPIADVKIWGGISHHSKPKTYGDWHASASAQTDAQGQYRIISPTPWLRELGPSKDGYKETSRTLSDDIVPPGVYDFVMTPVAPQAQANPKATPPDGTAPCPAPNPSVDLRPEFDKHGITIKTQSRNTGAFFAAADVLDFDYTDNQYKPFSASPWFLLWAAGKTDSLGHRGGHFGRIDRAITHYGIASLDLCPRLLPRDSDPTEAAIKDAESRKDNINIFWIKYVETPLGLSDQQLMVIKENVAVHRTVAIGFLMPKQIRFMPGLPYLIEETSPTIAQCMVVVGYKNDPKLPGGGALLLRSSLGPNWCDHGYAWISYDYARKYVGDAIGLRYQVRPEVFSPAKADLAKSVVFEAETLSKSLVRSARTEIHDMSAIKAFKWGGGKELWIDPTGRDSTIDLDFPVASEAEYWVSVYLTRANNFGAAAFSLDGKPIGNRIDCFGPDISRTDRIALGHRGLSAGKHTLSITPAGKCPATLNDFLAIDQLELTPAINVRPDSGDLDE